eukprot:TRINITY_DN68603_c0_g1_i1.p1 TRINITY_DN68603_c0_g1~~TRINITY_DN68603_c0_g1_i1.p1  ORF type:complete len:964 (-),score=166.27 TRINITY_DN68603_c0_g1_i1:126-3017(-)
MFDYMHLAHCGAWLLWVAILWPRHWFSAGKDVFRSLKEPSPREAAIAREMLHAANSSRRPWDGKRVVSAMTTTPKRIGLIEPALDSLLNMQQRLDQVYLFVPYEFKRDGSRYVLPGWLEAKKGVTIVRCEDQGPITHMREVLRRERDPDTFILQVDDDQSYGLGLLGHLMSATAPCPGRAIGAASQHAHSQLGGSVLEGVHGVLFQRKLFAATVFDYEGFDASCKLHDDLWLSAHLAERRVRRETLGERFGSVALGHGFGEDALYRGGAGSDNTRNFYFCMSSLLRKFPRLWEQSDRIVVLAPLLRGFGDDRSEAALAIRALRKLRRRSALGPHGLYLLGPVPEKLWGEAREESFKMPGVLTLRAGGFGDSIDLVLKDCVSTDEGCDLSGALRLALSLEEDPETIVIIADSPDPRKLWKVLKSHVKCHKQRPSGREGREPCTGAEGSLSFRRHAAFDEGRIQGGIFLPMFSDSFLFAGGWVEGWKLATRGQIWRDENGPWHKSATEIVAFSNFLQRGVEDEEVQKLWDDNLHRPRRFVATMQSTVRRAPMLRVTLRSLLGQRPSLQRIYVFVRSSRKSQKRCTPGAMLSWPRVHIICDASGHSGAPLVGLLASEGWPNTNVLHVDDAHKYGPRLLPGLLFAANLWQGAVIACTAHTYGQHGGPIGLSAFGVLYLRSFLDTRLGVEFQGACAHHIDLVAGAHIALKGLHTRVIGDKFNTETLQKRPLPLQKRHACREHLIHRHGWLWASRTPERCTVLVSPLEGTDEFRLDLTIRYAGLQTRKPDEVVLMLESPGILDEDDERGQDALIQLPDTEIDFVGALGSSLVELRTRSGVRTDVSLKSFLTSIRDRAGCVARVYSKYGPPREFVLSVTTCQVGACGVQNQLVRGFEHELDPSTALMFLSPERLMSERMVEDNLRCLSACYPNCGQQNWCGQPAAGASNKGALYDLTIRRAAGYHLHTAG